MIDEKLRRVLTEFASKYPLDIDTVEKIVKTKKEVSYFTASLRLTRSLRISIEK